MGSTACLRARLVTSRAREGAVADAQWATSCTSAAGVTAGNNMMCPTRLKLEKKYQDASATLASVENRFRQRIGVCPKHEFLSLCDQRDAALADLEYARDTLDQHNQEHCCMAQGSNAPI